MIDEHDALRAERRALFETLVGLDDDDWDAPSTCAGWRVRDVVAHVYMGATIRFRNVLPGLLVAGGDFDRFMARYAVRRGRRPVDVLLAESAMVAETAKTPPVSKRVDLAIDTFVHHHDIAGPLGRDVPGDPARLRWLADGMVGANRQLGSARRTKGLRLIATDIDWHYGTGPEVRGPAAALLVAACGRRVADDRLEGAGLGLLQERGG